MKLHWTLLLLLGAALAGCEKSAYRESNDGGEEAVQLKEGHGLALHPKLRKNIDLQITGVGEEKVAPVLEIQLHVVHGTNGVRQVAIAMTSGAGTVANGWLTAAQASHLKPGQKVELQSSDFTAEGVVLRIEKSPSAALGDFEVFVKTDVPLDIGTRLNGVFRIPAAEPLTAVPRSALLKTAEGWFVYVVNESFFLRTPVTVGAMNAGIAEITEGLYAGDQIVVSPVSSLWMAELQILRGGKSCTCGH